MLNETNQINLKTKTFNIPIEMVEQIEHLVDQRVYRSNSDFAREAFEKEINLHQSKKENNNDNE